jgi:hypothetical protein
MKIGTLIVGSCFLGLATLSGCPQTRPPAGFGIRVSNEKFQTRSDMVIIGKLFTSNIAIPVTITNFPRRDTISRTAQTDQSGNFTLRVEFAYVTVGRDEEIGDIAVTVRDDTTGFFDAKSVSSSPYLIRFP